MNQKQGQEWTIYQIAIVNPAVGLYLNYLQGAAAALETKNNLVMYMSALRGMIETTGAIAYFEANDPSIATFDRFLKTGRICEEDAKSDCNPTGEISKRQQIKAIDQITPYKNAVKIYDELCGVMHFTNNHITPTINSIKCAEANQLQTKFVIGVYFIKTSEIDQLEKIARTINDQFLSVLAHFEKYAKNGLASTKRGAYKPTEPLITKDMQDFLKTRFIK